MPNIPLTPEQITSIYWIALAVLGLFILLFTVKVLLDESNEEPGEFVKRYTFFILLSWVFIGLWFAPVWFPDYFKGMKPKKRGPTTQTQNDIQNKSADSEEGNKEDSQNRYARRPRSRNLDADSETSPTQDNSMDDESSTNESEDDSDDNATDESQEPVKKEFDPKVLKRVRRDKS